MVRVPCGGAKPRTDLVDGSLAAHHQVVIFNAGFCVFWRQHVRGVLYRDALALGAACCKFLAPAVFFSDIMALCSRLVQVRARHWRSRMLGCCAKIDQVSRHRRALSLRIAPLLPILHCYAGSLLRMPLSSRSALAALVRFVALARTPRVSRGMMGGRWIRSVGGALGVFVLPLRQRAAARTRAQHHRQRAFPFKRLLALFAPRLIAQKQRETRAPRTPHSLAHAARLSSRTLQWLRRTSRNIVE